MTPALFVETRKPDLMLNPFALKGMPEALDGFRPDGNVHGGDPAGDSTEHIPEAHAGIICEATDTCRSRCPRAAWEAIEMLVTRRWARYRRSLR